MPELVTNILKTKLLNIKYFCIILTIFIPFLSTYQIMGGVKFIFNKETIIEESFDIDSLDNKLQNNKYMSFSKLTHKPKSTKPISSDPSVTLSAQELQDAYIKSEGIKI
jgi:hypothetical protein